MSEAETKLRESLDRLDGTTDKLALALAHSERWGGEAVESKERVNFIYDADGKHTATEVHRSPVFIPGASFWDVVAVEVLGGLTAAGDRTNEQIVERAANIADLFVLERLKRRATGMVDGKKAE